MKVVLCVACVAVQFAGIASFIIPDELPSILSVIYSNIPTLKKGTDSRVGWGFRLGDRADFQVLLELGPQIYTQPLANQGDNNNNKRETLESLANVLYAQRQQEKKRRKEEETKVSSESEGGKWLETWRESHKNDTESLEPKPGIAVGEIDAKSVIPDDDELERIEKLKLKLKQMLKDDSVEVKKEEEPLDDVSLK